MMHRSWFVMLGALPLVLDAGCQIEAADSAGIVSPHALAVSQPPPVNKVNDAAIWVHPADPAKSILFISNELRGVELHDMDGLLQKLYADDDLRPNCVDLIYGFAINGERVDLALVSGLTRDSAGVKVYRIDPEKRRLTDVTAEHLIKVLDGAPPAGMCAYRSRKTGKAYFFARARTGKIDQYELIANADGTITAKRVRRLEVGSKGKFCVADDERGAVYFGEERAGVWRFDAEPDGAAAGKLDIRVGENGLIRDVDGMALYCAGGGRGYLIVVSQGPKGGRSTLKVYERGGDNRYVLTIDPAAAPFGKLERISGVAVTNRPTIAAFPAGVLAANDRINANCLDPKPGTTPNYRLRNSLAFTPGRDLPGLLVFCYLGPVHAEDRALPAGNPSADVDRPMVVGPVAWRGRPASLGLCPLTT